MTSSVCTGRLRKEYKEIQKKPVENILTSPRETNILEWHYVIMGPKGSQYEGGFYHGIVTFPNSYPYKPPSIQMLTPNGRFKPNTRLCLSMSDFHPETWNPMWSVGTILMGLYSFMLEESPTYGSMTSTDAFKRKCARESLAFNVKNKIFCELFPELVDQYQDEQQKAAILAQGVTNSFSSSAGSGGSSFSSSSSTGVKGAAGTTNSAGTGDGGDLTQQQPSWLAVLAVFAAICACTWALLKMSLV